MIGALVLMLLETTPPAWAASAHVIVDGPALLQQSPAQIEMSCGQPVRTKAVPPGDFRLPEGGMWRIYRGPGAQLDIDFDRERSTTVMIAFPDRSTAPTSYAGHSPRSTSRRADRPIWSCEIAENGATFKAIS